MIATSPLYGVLFDLRYSFFLYDQSVMAVTDSLSVPSLSPGNSDIDLQSSWSDAPPSPRVRRGKPRPAFPSLGGSGRLRDPRLALGEHVEVVVVPLAGRPRSRGALEDQLLGHVSTQTHSVTSSARACLGTRNNRGCGKSRSK